MRILLVSDSYGLVDGVSRSIEAELAYFRERSDTVVVVSTNTEHTRTYHLAAYRGFYHVFDADPRRLARRLRGYRFDVAYGHCVAPQGLFFLLYLSARFGVPAVNRFTTYAPDYMVYTYPPGSGPATQAFIRWMLTGLLGLTQRRMRRVLLSILCEKMRRYVVEVLRVAPWRVVENRFPERATPPPRTRPRPGPATDAGADAAGADAAGDDVALRLITPGRLSAEKNVEFLVSIWNEALADRYPRAEWHLVGPGPLTDWVRRSVRAPERVRLAGAVSRERMLREMVEADLMLYASLGDTFGLVITEAKLCRLPIVALADEAGVSAQITDGTVGGYLAANREAYVRTIHHALANPEEAARVAERGAEDVAERFSGAEYDRLADILHQAATARPSRSHRLTTLVVARLVRLLCWTLPRAFIRMYEPA